MGVSERNLLSRRAVSPLLVTVITASALMSLAVVQAAWAVAPEMLRWLSIFPRRIRLKYETSCSVRSAMAAMVRTASTGYFPAAVSPESITALVPSYTALATSVISARVGRGLFCILSSICVAVITGLPVEKL